MNNEKENLGPHCILEGDVAGFIYAELDTLAAENMTHHLAKCKGCSDEIDGLSSAMFAVRDWRTNEFESLSTPAIDLPKTASHRSGARTDIAAWFGLILRPRYAAAAVCVIVIAASAWIYVNSAPQPIDTVFLPTESQPLSASHIPNEVSLPRDAAGTGQTNVLNKGHLSSKNPDIPVRRAPQIGAFKTDASSIRHSDMPKRLIRDQYARKPATMPDVGEARETEDETLRLADLFSELDAG